MSAAEAAKWQEYYRQQQAAAAAAARYSSSGGSGRGGRKGTGKTGDVNYPAYPGVGGNRVYVPGYGDISYEDAERLERQGYIVLQGIDKDNNPIYARSTKKNINKPTRMTV